MAPDRAARYGEAEPTKYWLSSLPGKAPIPDLVATAKLR